MSTKKTEGKSGEIYVDVLEKLIVLFNSNGYVTNSLIEGCIQMKSYLKGSPVLKMALNDDLGIGKDSKSATKLDDYSFSECVDASDFEFTKAMKIIPPEGEFLAMSYRVTGDYMQPFRIFPIISEIGSYKLEVFLKISSQVPKNTTPCNLVVRFQVPSSVVSVHNELDEKASASRQKAEYVASSNMVEWHIKKFGPLSDHSLKTKISLQSNTNIAQAKKMIGPFNLQFEISMFNISNLSIRYLKIENNDYRETKAAPPEKWIRYITQSTSYQYRA